MIIVNNCNKKIILQIINMEKIFLIIIISSAIVLCLLIVNCINVEKEKFINHGGFFIKDKNYKNGNEYKLDCGGKLKITDMHKYSLSSCEKSKLKRISKKIINLINKDLKLNFHFVEIDYITKQEFGDRNIRYLLEIFIYEIRYLYNRRVMLDIFINHKTKKIEINNISILNAKKEKSNKLKLYEFDKKILENNYQRNNDLTGLNDTKLEFNILDYKPKHFNNKNFKEWIFPKEYLTLLNKYKWPCRNQEEVWDENGINLIEKNNKLCKGINTSFNNSKDRPIPKFLPNFKNIDGNSDLNWLFGKFKTDGRNIFMGGSN